MQRLSHGVNERVLSVVTRLHCRAAWQRMNASALSPRDLTALSSHGGWETNIHNVCTLKLPEQAALSLAQLSTPQLRVLAAYSGLQSADAPRPVLLGSLGGALSTEGKQQWVVQNAEVSLLSRNAFTMGLS